MLREAVFGLEHHPRHGGLRQRMLGLCSELSPVPEISFSGRFDKAVSEEAQAQILDLLRETFDLIEPDAVPGRVQVTVNADACLVVIDAASRERHAEETGPEQDFSGLLNRGTQGRVRINIQTSPGGIRVCCELPLSAPPRPVAADPARDLSGG